ncbi:MAG: S8 family serine peptidase, partial [Dehalococcoidia bacterium]
ELTLAFYGGTTGGNVGGSPSGTPASYSGFLQGTSFAAPIVAGGAALVVDVMKDIHSTDPQAIDGRVIKAILQTSAQKDPGWNNGQAPEAGVITTTQSLDWETGAGILDLAQAYSHITSGTANVPGLGGGAVATNGWDFGQVAQGTPNDYIIGTPLLGGSTLTVTLDWFVDSVFSTTSTLVRYGSMDNLNLSVWEVIGGVPTNLIAESISIYNNVEHLSFQIPQDGDYAMRVTWNGEIYDFNGDVNQEAYGLSWSGVAVPAPGGVIVLLGAAAGALRRRRRI